MQSLRCNTWHRLPRELWVMAQLPLHTESWGRVPIPGTRAPQGPPVPLLWRGWTSGQLGRPSPSLASPGWSVGHCSPQRGPGSDRPPPSQVGSQKLHPSLDFPPVKWGEEAPPTLQSMGGGSNTGTPRGCFVFHDAPNTQRPLSPKGPRVPAVSQDPGSGATWLPCSGPHSRG